MDNMRFWGAFREVQARVRKRARAIVCQDDLMEIVPRAPARREMAILT